MLGGAGSAPDRGARIPWIGIKRQDRSPPMQDLDAVHEKQSPTMPQRTQMVSAWVNRRGIYSRGG